MNITQIKTIPIPKVLAYFGKYPAYIKGNDLWYYALDRDERTPSLKVNTKENWFKDWGGSTKGSVIDIVIALKGYREVSQALEFLEFFQAPEIDLSNVPIIKNTGQKEHGKTIITRIDRLRNRNLLDYALCRSLDTRLLQNYCKEVYYKEGETEWYSIGFQNDSGGYALRNKFMKRAYPPGDITHIRNGSNHLLIFEGFMDFLSYLTVYPEKEKQYDFIILNSNANKEKIGENRLSKFAKVFLFLDNDRSGNETKKFFFSQRENVVDCSSLYSSFNDLNDWLVHRKS